MAEGVRIQSYSSLDIQGLKAKKIDEILRNHPHLISVWGAGNDRGHQLESLAKGLVSQYIAYCDRESCGHLWEARGLAPKSGWYLYTELEKTPPPGDGEYFGGYRTIVPEAATKNGIVVGAVDENKQMTSFSGWGPTDMGRIKPDVVANGDSLSGLLSVSGDYLPAEKGNGTSFSAPSVTGTAVLLVQHFQNLWAKPESVLKKTTQSKKPLSATIKALLIHTAEDLGNHGPDYQFGWGLVDAKAAADFLTAANQPGSDKSLRETVYRQEEQTIPVISDGEKPLKVTIAWTDKPGKNLINDLDLWVIETSVNGDKTPRYPWNLAPNKPAEHATRNRKNKFDNVEQVLIENPKKDATYTIHVGGRSDSQNYFLLIEGGKKLSVGKTSCLTQITHNNPEKWGRGPYVEENVRDIISASIKSTSEGFNLTMIEEKGKEAVIKFNKNLDIESAGTVIKEDYGDIYKAGDLVPWNLISNHNPVMLRIKPDGIFSIDMWVSKRSNCSFEGTAKFIDSAKSEIFGSGNISGNKIIEDGNYIFRNKSPIGVDQVLVFNIQGDKTVGLIHLSGDMRSCSQ